MFIVKLVGKILLVPVWIIMTLITAVVSVAVNILSFARVISGIVLTLLLIGTLFCYQDIIQVLFLIALIMIGYLLLFAGVTIEVILETVRRKVGNMILHIQPYGRYFSQKENDQLLG